jgi:hypothetical protein
MGILMGTEEQHRGILLKTMLRAISMVNVPIHDQDSAKSIFLLNIACGNSNVIEEAKPHRSRRFGMMTWRPDGTEHMINLVRHDGINRRQRPTCRQVRSIQ